jgi:hypothetical protein
LISGGAAATADDGPVSPATSRSNSTRRMARP